MSQQHHVHYLPKVKKKKPQRFVRMSFTDEEKKAKYEREHRIKVRPLLVIDPEKDRERNRQRLSYDRKRNLSNPCPPTLWNCGHINVWIA